MAWNGGTCVSLRGQLQDLYYAISADIEHGECFYDQEMFKSFCCNLDKMKIIAKQYFEENQMGIEEE